MPSEFTLYHNPRCSKSRAALALLEEKGVAADVVKYLDTAPDLATFAGYVCPNSASNRCAA